MTDTFYPTHTITSHAAAHGSLPNALAFTQNHRFNVPVFDGTQEDDGQISCFCGFLDDDGNTVACDSCNRWQHTICYYPEYEGRELPEELQHYCIDCRPKQQVDRASARARQAAKREQQDPYNGAKRQAAKSHKKKIKDVTGAPYTNGWPADKFSHDRNSASPRDQPPPAKRPKTSHRNSDNTTASSKGPARKRAGTNANHRRSLSRSPETPIDLYSEEFLRCYAEDDWSYSHANVMDELRVTNALSEWLQAPDDVFAESIGCSKPEVLNRWDGDLEDIPGKVGLGVQEHHDRDYRDQDGNYPTWKSVTVQDPLAPGAYIGELRGRIGFKDEYKSDPSNRWAALRHPEPFVFFHPRLPIYIDARHEGTELRYVRRSCTPNARLQVLVTNGTDYHFCLMASSQIDPGMEVAVAWDTTESIMPRNPESLSDEDITALCKWVSTVLAHCGPCACQLPPGECSMSRFDRRRTGEEADSEEAQPVKMPKAKKKKAAHHISPLNTNALNSRSGSEARKVEPDDEPTDSRSASGSAGRGSASRDNTPNTHYSAAGSLSTMPELSERERKKLAKEEEMFRRQEEERNGKQAKKKRYSAGSNATTPSATSSKPLTLPSNTSKYADAGTSKQSGLPSAKGTGKRAKTGAPKTPAKQQIKIVKRPAPNYVDAETQCDLDEEEAKRLADERAARPPRKFMSLTQRLLQRCAVNNTRTKMAQPPSPSVGTAVSPVLASAHSPPEQPLSPRSQRPESAASPVPSPRSSKPDPADDVPMMDAPPAEPQPAVPSIDEPGNAPQPPLTEQPGWRHHSTEPPVPPWPGKSSPTLHHSDSPAHHSHKPENMHLQMPPPPANPFAAASSHHLSSGTPNTANITGALAQSPSALSAAAAASIFSPTVTAAVTPSPAKKKMSLSDYTKRKAKVPDHESSSKGDRESSPASVASGPIVPVLQQTASEAGRNSQAVEDDVRMEDAGAAAGS